MAASYFCREIFLAAIRGCWDGLILLLELMLSVDSTFIECSSATLVALNHSCVKTLKNFTVGAVPWKVCLGYRGKLFNEKQCCATTCLHELIYKKMSSIIRSEN